MNPCDGWDDVEELEFGGLSDQAALRAVQHLAGCPRCQSDLECLRQQRDLLSRRATAIAVPDFALNRLFQEVDSQGHGGLSRVFGGKQGSMRVFEAFAAAAALLLALRTAPIRWAPDAHDLLAGQGEGRSTEPLSEISPMEMIGSTFDVSASVCVELPWDEQPICAAPALAQSSECDRSTANQTSPTSDGLDSLVWNDRCVTTLVSSW